MWRSAQETKDERDKVVMGNDGKDGWEIVIIVIVNDCKIL